MRKTGRTDLQVLSGLRKWALLAALLTLGACAEDRLSAVPAPDTHRAIVDGIADARIFSDDTNGFAAEFQRSVEKEVNYYASIDRPLPPSNVLVLSGGGDEAAFGAGLLVGLSESGRRPSFIAVTGISAGALIAPFAFLGQQYDPRLTQVFATLSPRDVFRKRPIVIALTSDAVADTTPLKSLIQNYVDQDIVDRIGIEYRHGRNLFVITTDFDSGLAVAWNIGAIADSGSPDALALIRKILLASASIPVAFPPVMFTVAVDGVSHQELHVDGGAIQQAFLYPAALKLDRIPALAAVPAGRAYIIRNGRLKVEWHQTSRSIWGVGARAFDTIAASEGDSDLYRIYAATKRDGVQYQLAFIDDDFTVPHPSSDFSHDYMTKLFAYARAKAQSGNVWQSAPPGF